MKKKKRRNFLCLNSQNRQVPGFTLIEMVVVVAIIVMLLIIIAPNLTKQKDSANAKTNDAFKTTLQTQATLYEDDKDREGKEITFQNMFEDGYLTKKQFAKSKKYTVTNGVVEKSE